MPVAMVLQKKHAVFREHSEENLLWGESGRSHMEEIEEACRIAGAD